MKGRRKEEWIKIFEESHQISDSFGCEIRSRLGYLASAIFGIGTYDSDMDELMAWRAIEVCKAISNRTTFDYIKDTENYRWYLIMCHLPFFADRIDWGGSIRGAWWSSYEGIRFESCDLYSGDAQMCDEIVFDEEGWDAFIKAVIEYGSKEFIVDKRAEG
ncbi:hypothetical protein FA071_04395 [Pseudomonas aeruginosa]|uniref:hypothetical protein n=1 Tax=Pseudomonas aeruginosa TaxID=287 RepID=UPI0012FE3111|nr:hypothetical protein [Pseudomonas aeruginosa]MCO3804711.1 hypothetical protein [Pseudomonas aeruginosa]MCT5287628.1 hypothetical protein [Pseudomonas aeruginosa]MCT5909140.1 hypothetical protein [Pseudomonas aeruginosa]HBO5586088.1 hypothetical protein [Pseudomonas aeruginosa]HCU2081792.1 hypothetical protein [Pseudomonas aeruginosa]